MTATTLRVVHFPTESDAADLTLREFYEQQLLPDFSHQSKNSIKEDRIALNHWDRIVGSVPLAGIGREHVQQLRDGLIRRGLSDATINKTWRELKAMLEAARDDDLIAAVPTVGRRMRSRLIRKEVRARQRELLTETDLDRLWKNCSKALYPSRNAPLLWRVVLVLMWTYGPRTLDCFNLEWDDVRWGDRLIQFRAMKTGKLQGLPMTDTVAVWLRKAKQGTSGRRVFPGFNSPGCRLTCGGVKRGYYLTWRQEISPGDRVLLKHFRQRVVTKYNAQSGAISLGSWIAGHSIPGVSAINYELPTAEIRSAIESMPIPACFLR